MSLAGLPLARPWWGLPSMSSLVPLSGKETLGTFLKPWLGLWSSLPDVPHRLRSSLWAWKPLWWVYNFILFQNSYSHPSILVCPSPCCHGGHPWGSAFAQEDHFLWALSRAHWTGEDSGCEWAPAADGHYYWWGAGVAYNCCGWGLSTQESGLMSILYSVTTHPNPHSCYYLFTLLRSELYQLKLFCDIACLNWGLPFI